MWIGVKWDADLFNNLLLCWESLVFGSHGALFLLVRKQRPGVASTLFSLDRKCKEEE